MSHKAPYSHISILIVDDDRAIRSLVARIASNWEYETEECPSAEDALQRLSERKFNIIITDINMGKMDGIEFAGKVREKFPSTAVIIMTGNPSPKTAKKSQDMGAIYYMQKPISMEELGETLKIASAWNIGMLIDRATKRYLALRKGHERDQENLLKNVKEEVRRIIRIPGWFEHLRVFVYSSNIEKNALYLELNKKFSTDSIKPF